MAMGSTQPLTEMSTRNLPGRKDRPAREADLTAICELIVMKMWEPRRLTTLWASTACYSDSVPINRDIEPIEMLVCPECRLVQRSQTS
jgi:hypothetical protein